MTARALPEWIGETPDSAIPPRVRLRIWERAEGKCQCCTRRIMAGERWQIDHTVALVNGGANRETNLRLLCDWCHRAKTKADVGEKAIVYRKRKRALGVKKPRTIRAWRRFNGEIVHAPRERT